VSGYCDTDLDRLVTRMHTLLSDRELAQRLGRGARAAAQQRFGIERFTRDWCDAFASVVRG